MGARAGLIFGPGPVAGLFSMNATDPPPGPPADFLLCSCQGGAEAALRQRAALVLPVARPAAWRRGVVSFRLPADQPDLAQRRIEAIAGELVFARTVLHSLGQVTGSDDAARASAAVERAGREGWQAVHVWSRAARLAAVAVDPEASAARSAVLAACGLPANLPEQARPGDRVLDCLIDSADRWWVGWHQAGGPPSCWPGGIHPAATKPLPAGVVSRAWLKLDEAIATFELPLARGQRAVELGAAPGGACQRLLEAGLRVVGVDPALVDPAVASLPGFTQWRMRAREVPVRRFKGCDWLLADMNIDPAGALAALGRVATARGVRLEGIVATLKIPDWSRAAALPEWLETFRGWGFRPQARQLSSGGREVCVVALRKPPSGHAARSRSQPSIQPPPSSRSPA